MKMKTSEEIINEIEERILYVKESLKTTQGHFESICYGEMIALVALLEFIKEEEK